MRPRPKRIFAALLAALTLFAALAGTALAADGDTPVDEPVVTGDEDSPSPEPVQDDQATPGPEAEDTPMPEDTVIPVPEDTATPAPDSTATPVPETTTEPVPVGDPIGTGQDWPQEKINADHTVTVQVSDPGGGTASASPAFAAEGDSIVLTATPGKEYHLTRWVTQPEVEVTDNRFTMPNEDVTVTAVLEKHAYRGGVCAVCGYSYDYDIFVKTLTGKHITLHVKSTDTVLSVKEKIKANEGIPVSVQVLKLPALSAELEDDQCLGDCGVIKDSTLHLTLRYAPEGAGTADEPFLIPDGEQLEAFRYYINDMASNGGAGRTFRLTADIALTESWTPVGNSAKPFAGVFDGGGHTVSGLYIDGASNDQGLFGAISGGTVKDLTVAGSVTGRENVGTVAGQVFGGTVSGCRNDGAVTGTANDVGGIVGISYMDTVSGCTNTGAVTAGSSVGGIMGYGYVSAVENSNTGAVTGGSPVGGIAGHAFSTPLENCCSAGASSVGGIAGDINSEVNNCYYLDAYGAYGKGTPLSAEAFASGQVAWLLQKGLSAPEPLVWGQRLGADAQPVLTAAAEKRVCRVTLLAPDVPDFEASLYANFGGTLPALATLAPAREGYELAKWSLAADGSGETFTAASTVAGDMTLYALYALKPASTDTATAPTSAAPAATAPPTSDAAQPALWLAVMVLSLAGLMLIRKRRSGGRG